MLHVINAPLLQEVKMVFACASNRKHVPVFATTRVLAHFGPSFCGQATDANVRRTVESSNDRVNGALDGFKRVE